MAFKSLKPEEFLAYWRRAGRQSSEILQLPTNSDVTTSPELDYTHTNDTICHTNPWPGDPSYRWLNPTNATATARA